LRPLEPGGDGAVGGHDGGELSLPARHQAVQRAVCKVSSFNIEFGTPLYIFKGFPSTYFPKQAFMFQFFPGKSNAISHR
jgi:hypothetical protein